MIPLVSPCAIPHHAPDSRVGFHQWHNGAGVMEYFFGRVVAHSGRQISVETDHAKLVVTLECGAVFPVGEMGGE